MAEPHRARDVCIIGATSAMAEAVARTLAARGDRLALVARDAGKLEAIASDLRSRGAMVAASIVPDLAALVDPDAPLAWAHQALGGLDAILIFHGYLGDQGRAEVDPTELRKIMTINAISALELVTAGAARLEASPHPAPVILAIGSVAGDRGRASNFLYAAAKAALAVGVQGLAHSLAQKGSHVRPVVVKAGLTDTPMTADMAKGGPLWASAETVAAVVVKAMNRGGPIVYAPARWRWIMLIIRLLPQPIMNRLSI